MPLRKRRVLSFLLVILAVSVLLVASVPVLAGNTLSYLYVAINPSGQMSVVDGPDDLRGNQTLAILATKAHIDDLLDRLEDLSDRIDDLDVDLADAVASLEHDIAALQGQVSTLEDALNAGLANVQNQLAGLENEIEDAIAGIQGELTALEAEIEAAIEDLDERIGLLETIVTALEDRMTDLETANAALQADMTAMEADMAALQDSLATMQTMLDVVFPAPLAEITIPEDGDVLSGKVTFEGIAYSPYIDYWFMQWVGVRVVSITNGSENVGEPGEPGVFRLNYDIDYWLDLDGWLEPGAWTIQLYVYDLAGRRTLTEIPVTIAASD